MPYYNWFYRTWWITLLWPSLSLYRLFRPHVPFLYFMFPMSSLKTCNNCHTQLLIHFSCIYVNLTLKPAFTRVGCVQKAKWFWSFSWCGSESLVSWTSICLEITWIRPYITSLKRYIRKPLDTLKGEELKSKRTIVHCCRSLYLSLHPFVPWSTSCSSQAYLCLWACYREMKDWSGGGPGGGLSFSDSQTCRQRLSLL